MKRRRFLSLLGLAPAAALVARELAAEPVPVAAPPALKIPPRLSGSERRRLADAYEDDLEVGGPGVSGETFRLRPWATAHNPRMQAGVYVWRGGKPSIGISAYLRPDGAVDAHHFFDRQTAQVVWIDTHTHRGTTYVRVA